MPSVQAEVQSGEEYKLQQKCINYHIGNANCGSLQAEKIGAFGIQLRVWQNGSLTLWKNSISSSNRNH